MLRQVRAALVVLAVMTVITGVLYPLLITGIAQAAFPHQANGSLIVQHGEIVGSELVGQPFDVPKYFWGRISATAPVYNGQSSTGSNLGPTNPALADEVKGRIDALYEADPEAAPEVPVDLVTSSGSGLDPDISPAAAEYQVRRVAKARGWGEERVRALVAEHTTGRQLGVLGEPRVNVLELNLELDATR
jgi:potassium-transporting ATPase KdpC subunit